MTFGICTPYTRDEATWMAFSLAATMQNLGERVEFMPLQHNEPGLHFSWDSHVACGKKWKNFKTWATRVRQLVWFDLVPQKLKIAKKLGIRNIYVVLWHRLQAQDLYQLEKFDGVVFPSLACDTLFADSLRGVQAATIPWDVNLPLRERKQFYQDGKKRVLVLLSGGSVRYATAPLLATIRVLVDRDPTLRFTLAPMRSFPKPLQAQVNDLVTSRSQVTIVRNLTYWERTQAIESHDWTFCPSLAENSGLDALESLALGTPVLTFDVPPFTEIVKDNVNGRLIPCELQFSDIQTPRPRPNSSQMLDVLVDTLSGSRCRQHMFDTMPSMLGRMETRRRNFQKGWRSLWDGV